MTLAVPRVVKCHIFCKPRNTIMNVLQVLLPFEVLIDKADNSSVAKTNKNND